MAKDPVKIRLSVLDFQDEYDKAVQLLTTENIPEEMEKVFKMLYPMYGTTLFVEAWGVGAYIAVRLAQRLKIGSRHRPLKPTPELIAKLKALKAQEMGK